MGRILNVRGKSLHYWLEKLNGETMAEALHGGYNVPPWGVYWIFRNFGNNVKIWGLKNICKQQFLFFFVDYIIGFGCI